jgi:hypothetical protein
MGIGRGVLVLAQGGSEKKLLQLYSDVGPIPGTSLTNCVPLAVSLTLVKLRSTLSIQALQYRNSSSILIARRPA